MTALTHSSLRFQNGSLYFCLVKLVFSQVELRNLSSTSVIDEHVHLLTGHICSVYLFLHHNRFYIYISLVPCKPFVNLTSYWQRWVSCMRQGMFTLSGSTSTISHPQEYGNYTWLCGTHGRAVGQRQTLQSSRLDINWNTSNRRRGCPIQEDLCGHA